VTGWTIVIPVKGTAGAKSRLGASAPLALAIAGDTVAAAAASDAARRVIVVTAADSRPYFEALGAEALDDSGFGLADAVSQGVRAAGPGRVAVLLGDVPGIQAGELSAALRLADGHPLGFVADADGVGTVLITALAASDHRPAFGGNSRAAHLAAGYVELTVEASSGLRRDVDTRAQLEELRATGRLGFRTAAAIDVA
jgi:2-phospho-L-lactate guanylyltransferase